MAYDVKIIIFRLLPDPWNKLSGGKPFVQRVNDNDNLANLCLHYLKPDDVREVNAFSLDMSQMLYNAIKVTSDNDKLKNTIVSGILMDKIEKSHE